MINVCNCILSKLFVNNIISKLCSNHVIYLRSVRQILRDNPFRRIYKLMVFNDMKELPFFFNFHSVEDKQNYCLQFSSTHSHQTMFTHRWR